MYWTSDYSAMHSASDTGVAWVATVHMHSNRTVSARCVNGQAALSEHTGDGMVYTYQSFGTECLAFCTQGFWFEGWFHSQVFSSAHTS